MSGIGSPSNLSVPVRVLAVAAATVAATAAATATVAATTAATATTAAAAVDRSIIRLNRCVMGNLGFAARATDRRISGRMSARDGVKGRYSCSPPPHRLLSLSPSVANAVAVILVGYYAASHFSKLVSAGLVSPRAAPRTASRIFLNRFIFPRNFSRTVANLGVRTGRACARELVGIK